MSDILKTIIAFLFGAGGLAVINVVQERWKWKKERKAVKEDREEEKEDKLTEISQSIKELKEAQDTFNEALSSRVSTLEDQNAAQNEGMKHVLLDRILYLGQRYISDGEVTYDNRKRLGDMHSVYHTKLKGNGDADAIMNAVYELPLKK